ncbi:hypothetical protein BJ912DRAFT_63084 [Pholiota molesta]|nr:hypothetical protein BJ912DRAFT_63084 [Pholiota molesta]
MEGTIQPFKEGDVVLLSEPIKCRLYYGTPKVDETSLDNTEVDTGADRKYTIISKKESAVTRTSISSNDPVPQIFWYRVISKLGEERYRYKAVQNGPQLTVKIPHSVLSSPPQLPIDVTEFLEMSTAALITGPRVFSCQIQHKKFTLKAGDLVMIDSPPITASGSSHTAISKKNAHYLVRVGKWKRMDDLFWKSTRWIDHSQIAGPSN